MMQGRSNATVNNSNGQNNLLTASLTQKVSSLKSLSDAFKEMNNERQQNNEMMTRQENNNFGGKLEVNGTAANIVNQTFGAQATND